MNQAAKELLLLVARERLSAEQQQRAIHLARQVDDWNLFVGIATRSLGLCLAYACLSRLPEDSVPSNVLQSMKTSARLHSAKSLLIEATYHAFRASVLDPSGAEHVFFKGPAMAWRYYTDPALRLCRDLDVLVKPKAALDVVRRAIACGYKAHGVDGDLNARDVAAWVQYGTVFPMRAPSGVLVEIHKFMDHGEGFFDTHALIQRAEAIESPGGQMRVLRTSDLFVYICMHHTRHFWSHLHWFSDLDAVCRHSTFDLADIQRVANETRLGSTVDACLEMAKLAAGGDWRSSSLRSSAETDLLETALDCLIGGRPREDALRSTRLSSDRAFDWQLSAPERLTYLLGAAARKCKPTYTDYRAWPLPTALQPLYYLTRPLRVVYSALRKRAGFLPLGSERTNSGGAH